MDCIKAFAAAYAPPSQMNLQEVYDHFQLKEADIDAIEEMRRNLDDSLDATDKSRISKLQKKLKENQFIYISKSGSWPGEYVARSQEYLWWLTGFSGSSGSCLIGRNQAILFSDSRYIIQAQKQAPHMTFFNIAQKKPLQWLSENTNETHEILINGWTTDISFYHKLQNRCLAAKLTVLDDFSIVEDLWPARLPLPCSPIWQHELVYSGKASVEKITYYQQNLSQHDLDGFIITQPENIAWLLNIRSSDIEHTPIALSFAIVWKDGYVDWYMDKRRLTQKLYANLKEFVRFYAADDIKNIDLSSAKIGYNGSTTVISLYNRLTGGRKDIMDPAMLPKACKNSIEQMGMINAHILDGLAMVRFLYWLEQEIPKGHVTEISAAEKLNNLRFENRSCLSLSFETISASGPNAALPHYHASAQNNRKLSADEIYLIDSGAQYQAGTTDITRTIKISSATMAEKKAFTLVLKGFIALFIHQFKEGTVGHKLDTIARKPLNDHGMDFGHGTGHGVGCCLGVHEGPQSISAHNDHIGLIDSMVCSIEPGYYEENNFGIRIENLAIVKSLYGQCFFSNLTYCPIDTRLIKHSLLTQAEKDWLNNYHQKVCENLTPLLQNHEKIKIWLQKVTREI